MLVVCCFAFIGIVVSKVLGFPPGLSNTVAAGLVLTAAGYTIMMIGSSDNKIGRIIVALAGTAIALTILWGGSEVIAPGHAERAVREAKEKVAPNLPILPPEEITAGVEDDAYRRRLAELDSLIQSGKLTSREEAYRRREYLALKRPKDTLPIAVFDRMLDGLFGSKKTIEPAKEAGKGMKWLFLGLAGLGLLINLLSDKQGLKQIGIGLLLMVAFFAGMYYLPQLWEVITRWWNSGWEAKAFAGCIGIIGAIILFWFMTKEGDETPDLFDQK